MKGSARFFILFFIVMLILCAGASSASTSTGGSTGSSCVFFVEVTGNDAYITLTSYRGTADVDDYSWLGKYKRTTTKNLYGFYSVIVTGDNTAWKYNWTPSKTILSKSSYVRSKTLRIKFPETGRYTVEVAPFDAGQISDCWYFDKFSRWTDNAVWSLGTEYNCACFYEESKRFDSLNVHVTCYDIDGRYLTSYTETITSDTDLYPRPIDGYYSDEQVSLKYVPDAEVQDYYDVAFNYRKAEGQVEILCYDSYGSLLDSYTETVQDSRYISPREISGYRKNSSAQYVRLDRNSYTCSPSLVVFRYTREEPAVTGCVIQICLYDVSSGNTLNSWYTHLDPGYNIVTAENVPSGYRVTDLSRRSVYVDNAGNPSENPVYFGCRKIQQEDPQPESPAENIVIPYDWDTQYRDSENNPQAARLLPNLCDRDTGTSFHYTVWYGDRTDNKPEITAYFSNATVSRIGIINGNVTSQDQYYQRARASTVRARIYASGGTYETQFTIPDTYTRQYQEFSLGGTYSDVVQIDLFLEGLYKGQDKPQYEMNITEIRFYDQ